VTKSLDAVHGLDDAAVNAAKQWRFEPVLKKECFGCHSAKAKEIKGGLRLDTRLGLRSGGDSGPVVVEGKADRSRLVQAIRHEGDLAMPPEKPKLPDDKPKVDASLVPERAGVAPGGIVTVALNQIIRKTWHTYWINPGDAGAPTIINWHLPPGWSAGPIQWPYPKHLPVGPLMDYGYEDQVALLTDVTAPADAKPGDQAALSADVMLLVCAEVCVPEEKHLTLPLAVTASPPPSDAKTVSLFAETRAKLPHASPWSAIYDADDKRFALLIQSPELVAAKPREIAFYPYTDGMVEPAAAQLVGTSDKGLVIESRTGHKLADKDKRDAIGKVAGLLVLTGADGRVDALDVQAQPGAVPASSVTLQTNASNDGLPQLLLFALLGGLILNLMPCVFPVLSMKALALAAKRDAPGSARAAAFAYGAGVVLSFQDVLRTTGPVALITTLA
jgi:thiol:disulfide interchange protein DsbD